MDFHSSVLQNAIAFQRPENEGDIETVFFCEFILFTSLLFVVVFTYIMIGYGGHVINNGRYYSTAYIIQYLSLHIM